MTMPPKSRPHLVARSLRRFSTRHAKARSIIELSSQKRQEASAFDIRYRDHIYSPMRRFALAARARSYSPHSRAPSAALKSP
jgi:hypothetical protein